MTLSFLFMTLSFPQTFTITAAINATTDKVMHINILLSLLNKKRIPHLLKDDELKGTILLSG